MKGLVRPHQSSRFASHTVTVTKSSDSMKLGGRYLVTHEAMPEMLRSGATLAPRGCGVASGSCELSTKESTSRAKRSNDAQERVVIARTPAIQCGSIIVEERAGVPTPRWSEECRTQAIDDYLAGDRRASGTTWRNGGSGIGPPPRDRRRRSEQVDIVQWLNPHASLIYDTSHSSRASCGLPTPRPRGMAGVVQSRLSSGAHHPPLENWNQQTSKELPSAKRRLTFTKTPTDSSDAS